MATAEMTFVDWFVLQIDTLYRDKKPAKKYRQI